jgi:Family of unknown function (DUF6131)
MFKEDLGGSSIQRIPNHPYSAVRSSPVIILGIILLIIGFVTGISIVWTIGIIAVVIGLILAVLGFAGHAIGGRRHYY